MAESKTKRSLWTAPAKINTSYKRSIFFLLLINVIVGRMCDLSLRLEKELDKKDQAEMELQQHKIHLEEMIGERTTELMQANKELQQEIGERRQVTNALRESEEKYRLLVRPPTRRSSSPRTAS